MYSVLCKIYAGSPQCSIFEKMQILAIYLSIFINASLTFPQRTFEELKKKRDQWIISEPWLPQLEDEILSRMKSFITDCLRIAWRMVNLLPPLKIMLADDDLKGERFDDFFHIEKEVVRESTLTRTLCVWPTLTDYDGNEVLVKGSVVMIQAPKRRQEQTVKSGSR